MFFYGWLCRLPHRGKQEDRKANAKPDLSALLFLFTTSLREIVSILMTRSLSDPTAKIIANIFVSPPRPVGFEAEKGQREGDFIFSTRRDYPTFEHNRQECAMIYMQNLVKM